MGVGRSSGKTARCGCGAEVISGTGEWSANRSESRLRRWAAGTVNRYTGARLIVFGVGPATRIYLAAGATDMRKGFEGLYGLVRDHLLCEPLSGHIFVFANSGRNRLKLMFYDGSGLWVCAKRLEKGRFGWPEADSGESKVRLSQEELALLLGGIDLEQTRRRRWHRVESGKEEKSA